MSSARRHSLPTSLLYHDSSSNGNGHANGSASRRGPTANGIAALGPLYLGLEVALDRVRAVVLDGELGIAHSVELELGSLQASPPTADGLQRGSDGRVTQSLELVLAGLDGVLEQLSMSCDLGRVASIGGCAHSALVLLTTDFAPALATIPTSSALRTHFADSNAFVTPSLMTALDTTTTGQRSVLLKAAATTSAGLQLFPNPLLLQSGAVQLLRLPWKKAEDITPLAGLVESLLVGRPVGWEESTAAEVSGLWDARAREWSTKSTDLVAGGADAGVGLRERLGLVTRRVDGESSAAVSEYLQERFGFASNCRVTPFVPQSLASYLSLCPASGDVALSFDHVDTLSFPLPAAPAPSVLYQVLPHPAQRAGESPRFIGQISNCNGHVARNRIMSTYANASWRVLGQMVSPIVPPGGSLGFDDKLFTFVWPNSEVHPFGVVDGHVRFENGISTTEFRDLRANPRCLIESQLLSFRARYSSIFSAEASGRPPLAPPLRTALTLGFDPFDDATAPLRILVAESPMQDCQPIMGVVADVFGAPVSGACRPASREAEGSLPPTTPSAATLGCAYLARWADSSPPDQDFEPFILSLLNSRSSIARPTLRSRLSRSSLSNGSAVTLAAISETSGTGEDDPNKPLRRSLHRSKSAHHLSIRQNGAGSAYGRHSPATLTPLAAADRDAFRAYCSMVPEFLRLEELFVKGLVHPPPV